MSSENQNLSRKIQVIKVRNLNYEVPIKFYDKILSNLLYKVMKINFKENKRYKRILNNINLDINVGEFVGIIGCSGCGKSSLLNILNNKIYTKTYRGEIRIQDQEIGPQIKQDVGYVMQEDILFPVDTPFETLQFVQRLKMQTYQKETIRKILKFVGLTHVQSSFIGSSGQQGMNSSFIKTGISGGERRRVSLARELISGCKILLCDEITSGLDLVTANNICSLLRKLTSLPYDFFENQFSKNQNLTCVCTLHQPSSKIFSMLDRIIVMSQGQIVYSGKPEQFYKNMNQICQKVPKQYNPADFLIELSVQAQEDFMMQQKLKYLMDNRVPESFIEFRYPDVVENQISRGNNKNIKKQMKDDEILYIEQNNGNKTIKSQPTETYKTEIQKNKRFIPKPTLGQYYRKVRAKRLRNPLEQIFISLYEIIYYKSKYKKNYFYQFCVLLERFQRFHLRNPILYIRFGCQYTIFALFAGSLYWRLDRDFEGIQTAVGALLLVQMCCCFTPANEASLRYFNNRQAYLREHSSGLYGTSLYYIAQMLVDFPIYFVCCLIFSVITWFMIGFNDSFQRWLLSFIILLMLLYAILSFSIAFTYITDNYVNASVIIMVILTILVVYAGPQINQDTIPDYYKWMPWISMFSYSYRGLMYVYLYGQSVECFSSTCLITTSQQAFEYLGLEGYTLYSAVSYALLFLGCQALIFYTIGYVGLRYKRFG